MIEQQQLSIINHLVKAVNNNKPTQVTTPPVPRPRSITPNPVETVPTLMMESQSAAKTPEPIPNFKQRTWKEREEELHHLDNGEELIDEQDGKVNYDYKLFLRSHITV